MSKTTAKVGQGFFLRSPIVSEITHLHELRAADADFQHMNVLKQLIKGEFIYKTFTDVTCSASFPIVE